MTRIILLALLLTPVISFSQHIQEFEPLKFEIKVCNSPQKITFTKIDSTTFKGEITVELFEKKLISIDEDGHKNYERTNFKISYTINTDLATCVAQKLVKAGVLNLKKCASDPGCNMIAVLDGDFFIVDLYSGNTKESFEYIGIQNTYYSLPEINPIRRHAQLISTIVNEELDLKKQLKTTFSLLNTENRSFCYLDGITEVCIKTRPKKH